MLTLVIPWIENLGSVIVTCSKAAQPKYAWLTSCNLLDPLDPLNLTLAWFHPILIIVAPFRNVWKLKLVETEAASLPISANST